MENTMRDNVHEINQRMRKMEYTIAQLTDMVKNLTQLLEQQQMTKDTNTESK